jgi:NAD(P)-dependent dehydrogenase (short-subunit alcohol dehydrogenase family)
LLDSTGSRGFARGPALVTGAGRGIGRAIAIQLADAGHPVSLAARSGDELDLVAEEISERGGRALTVICDVTAGDAIDHLVERTVGELGGLQILVNNAGGAHRVLPLDELTERDFDRGTALNYTSVYRTMHVAAPHLFEAAPHASVLNVVSVLAQQSMPGVSYYSGAKAGVVALSRSAAREWGPRGVRVNCIGPGWIETELSRPLRESEDFTAETLAQVPLGRWGTAEEIADVATFLVSDAARYVTGATLYADGGLLA